MTGRTSTRTAAWIGACLVGAIFASPASAQLGGGGTGGTGTGTGTGTGGTRTSTGTGTGTGTTTGTGGSTTTPTTPTPTTPAAAPATALTPQQEMMVLLQAVAATDFLMAELGIQFTSDVEAFLFLVMIYDSLYQQTLQQMAARGPITGLGGRTSGLPGVVPSVGP